MDCLLDKNPNFPVDESESWKDLGTADHDVFRVAESCGFYLYTPQIQHRIDVDGEALEDYKDQPELYDLIQTHY
ncbi:hypothetical protein CLV58_109137 [Spirosoma oryzae]|uniref:Uncharacterized protein n=1 Tax=Spirosoma oryzae TaxID=1469603 RepID=A0A2T0SYC8_9BACT|nr:hypothetical protein [Spirosoma oryzae]PRY38410.1 hypothetical protein CLV58_109137 [Spirosoma oryzae]